MLIVRRAVLCCLIAIGCSAQPASAQESPQQHPPQASESAGSANAHNADAKQPPLAVEIKSMPERTQEERAEQAEDRRDKAHTDRWLVRLTAVIAVFTVVLAIATGFLWQATNALVREAKESGERQQRAYVNVYKVYAVWEDTEDRDLLVRPITIRVETKNSGQTPARKVVGWANSESCPTVPTTFFKPSDDGSLRSVAVCAPGQSYHFEINRRLVLDAESEITIWSQGRESLYVWGEIAYIDAFNEERWTRFRYVMPKEGVSNKGGKFRSCGAGNDIT